LVILRTRWFLFAAAFAATAASAQVAAAAGAEGKDRLLPHLSFDRVEA